MKEHQYKKERYVASVMWYVAVSVLAVFLVSFPTEWRQTIVEWHKSIIEVRTGMPFVFSIITTIIGVFITFYLLRPKMKISNVVAYLPKTQRLIIHVKNMSLINLSNIKPVLYKCTYQRNNKVIEKLDLDIPEFLSLSWKFAHTDDSCIEFATPKDDPEGKINNVLEEMEQTSDVCLLFSISATNLISHTQNVMHKTFYRNDILVGRFKDSVFFEIDDQGAFKDKVKVNQDAFDRLHSISSNFEIFIWVAFFVIFIFSSTGYPENFELMALALWMVDIGRLLSDIKVPARFNESLTYRIKRKIENKSLSKKEPTLIIEIICLVLRRFCKN